MAVTANRLGNSSLLLDWSNLGSTTFSTEADQKEFENSWQKVHRRFDQGEVGFYNAPIQPTLSQIEESEQLAKNILQTEKFTDCLFLGIGGSALGPISLLSALEERKKTKIHFHFMENPDPTDWKTTLSRLNPETTLVCIVTKSGTTFETMAQALLALQWLEKKRWVSNVVAITDPTKGDLRTFATQNKISTLSIDPSIGGRFSIFSPVGLFPAALSGLSTRELLQGAKQVREYIEKTPPHKNPLFLIGASLIRQFEKRPIHFCMPYSTRLKFFGSWFAQLWGESLGKDGKGFTPLSALGATDQHSILQLLRDGPDDKVTFFISVDQVGDPVKIPSLLVLPSLPAFSILEGHSLEALLNTEYAATKLVLARKGRPNFSLKLDRLDENSLGGLYFAMSVLTAFTGTLWLINPFDQPGVEEGKIYTRQALEAMKAQKIE